MGTALSFALYQDTVGMPRFQFLILAASGVRLNSPCFARKQAKV